MVYRLLRTFAVLAAVVLAAPWGAAAAPPDFSSFHEAPAPGLWSRVSDWLTAVWAEAGCIADPDGCTEGSDPGDTPADSHADEGCVADPDGGTCRGRQ